MNLIKKNFQIVRLSEGDARFESDSLRHLKSLLLANEVMYPGIDRWYKDKVVNGIKRDERVAFVGYFDEKPVASAVLKRGADAKFCHLRINEDIRENHLGEVFFSLMALEVRDLAKDIHFTLPETLWMTKSGFFRSFSFDAKHPAESQYRLFDRELYCSAHFSRVWQSTIEKIPKLSEVYDIGNFSAENQVLLSVKPKYAEAIFKGRKTVEIRRKFSTRWLKQKINIYASAPSMSLMGEAIINAVEVGDPQKIWSKYSNEICCSHDEFFAYASGCLEVYAIELADVKRYRAPIPLAQIAHLLNEALVPPQSYLTLEKNKPWAKAFR
jgi:predicted transcriptional regulator